MCGGTFYYIFATNLLFGLLVKEFSKSVSISQLETKYSGTIIFGHGVLVH